MLSSVSRKKEERLILGTETVLQCEKTVDRSAKLSYNSYLLRMLPAILIHCK
jgi:hypothetical protein